VLSEPHRSSYAARNAGLRAAAGELVAFTDADCVARPGWLRLLTEAIADRAVMVVMGRDRPAGRSRAVRLLAEYDHFKEVFVLSGSDPAIYYGHTNNMIVRRHVFERVGLFDEGRRGSDVILVHRVVEAFGTDAVRYEPEALVDHLEIASAAAYFRKAFVYGRSERRYSGVVRARPLRTRERLRIFRDTVRGAGVSPLDSTFLFALLACGVGFFGLGRLSVPPWSAGRKRAPGRAAAELSA
jgi:glycosyltransferase involved in cell wall biosynthesis